MPRETLSNRSAAPGAALEARGLGKRYDVDRSRPSTVLARARRMFGAHAVQPLWAVRGVDLSVRRGESLALIGANGAGKTTLLLLLAGLLEPTEGRVAASGRVAPFFRIGSGLHSELTVLDNLRLASALFGLSSEEFRRRLGAIAAFGELEPLLDARLGELSSGYQARVPFAAALHADLDIVLIDEILSVGDARFQARCLARLGDLRRAGKTFLFASHDLGVVQEHADRAVLLSGGRVVDEGAPSDVVRRYVA